MRRGEEERKGGLPAHPGQLCRRGAVTKPLLSPATLPRVPCGPLCVSAACTPHTQSKRGTGMCPTRRCRPVQICRRGPTGPFWLLLSIRATPWGFFISPKQDGVQEPCAVTLTTA